MKKRTWIRIIVIWLFLLALPSWQILTSAMEARKLALHGTTTIGTVVERHPENHRSIRCKWVVAGKEYFGSTSLTEKLGLASFDHIAIGDEVPIRYMLGDPEVAVIGDPKKLLQSDLLDEMAFAIFTAFAAFFIEWRIRSRYPGWR